ncbi:aldo/keto reductase [Mucilaginibacter sp. BT774]|uniref:aldo/keto reductase n=1 Tax=Mucilaginibacter sp. BT774 TaxID=3062276 RepID=UPI002675DCEA|nr:aldo/keto reductase [Mucilaginibacter sp. BT774]MDO3628961.1 aldo/keto reductase [Mucilaginibacter sp. BT774]
MKKHQEPEVKGLDKAPLSLPAIIFGTSGLGNLFVALDEEEKLNIVSECVRLSDGKVVFDSAGKYGAGLALETLGKCLRKLNISQENVIISNKLGWLRTELKTEEPTFEPGVWKNLKYDAVQKISYKGIIECFDQGNELLSGYIPQMVSVHDPDEYISTAKDHHHAEELYNDILAAYEALYDLKKQGKVKFIGVGAKNWKIIKRLANDVQLDWIMIANSMTIKRHPQELLDFIAEMERKGVYVVNSAVFHSGFLVGSNHFDYRLIERGTSQNDGLYKWREHFFEKCNKFNIKPSEACVQFALNVPGVKSIALNTTNAARVQSNLGMLNANIPPEFWQELKINDLIEVDFVSWLQQAATA